MSFISELITVQINIMPSISLKDIYLKNLFSEIDDSGSDTESTSDIAEEPSKSAEEIVREWVWENNPSVNSVNDLLLRMSALHPELPRDYRTLMKTPQ